MSEAIATEYGPEVIRVGDWYVNEGTGEIVGLVAEEREPFRVVDIASAEWVMSLLAESEAEVAAIAKRRAVLLANLEAMEKPAMRRVEWLRYRFGQELEAFARSELEGKKERNIATPFGRLAFRKVKARLKVVDEPRALDWCRENFPAAVKRVESVLVSELWTEVSDVAPPGFSIEAAHDSFKVSTGFGS